MAPVVWLPQNEILCKLMIQLNHAKMDLKGQIYIIYYRWISIIGKKEINRNNIKEPTIFFSFRFMLMILKNY